MGTCKEKGTTSLFPASFDKIQLSRTGLITLFWALLGFLCDFGDSSIFFTPNGTGHNDPLEMVRYTPFATGTVLSLLILDTTRKFPS